MSNPLTRAAILEQLQAHRLLTLTIYLRGRPHLQASKKDARMKEYLVAKEEREREFLAELCEE